MASPHPVSLVDGPRFVAIIRGHIVLGAYAATLHAIAIINHRRRPEAQSPMLQCWCKKIYLRLDIESLLT